MANVKEWLKGITFFLVATILFYFFWDNIFSNIIGFLGSDLFGIGSEATQSIAILKTVGWISFIFLWLATTPVYLIYSFIAGSKAETKTHPMCFFKAIGLWAVMMPILSFIYGLVHFLVVSMNASGIADAEIQTVATQFSWIFALIILGAIVFVPFYYILKGYGVIDYNE